MELKDQIERGTLCSLDSLEADEEMYGTATSVETWFVLEYSGRWSSEAFSDSRIPDAVKTSIKEFLDAQPNSRLQLVKKQDQSSKSIKLFIARSQEENPSLSEITLGGYEELLDSDLESILRDKATEKSEPLFLICTNGEHDQCCGKFGMPVYLDAATGVHGSNTWQSTHIGGHRFASTFVCLPHGLYYGRVRNGEKANEIFAEYAKGRIELASYRGRSCYSPPVQAAEYYLRIETGVKEIRGFNFKCAGEDKGDIKAEFISATDNKIYIVSLRKLDTSLKVLKSCGDRERSFITQFTLSNIKEA